MWLEAWHAWQVIIYVCDTNTSTSAPQIRYFNFQRSESINYSPIIEYSHTACTATNTYLTKKDKIPILSFLITTVLTSTGPVTFIATPILNPDKAAFPDSFSAITSPTVNLMPLRYYIHEHEATMKHDLPVIGLAAIAVAPTYEISCLDRFPQMMTSASSYICYLTIGKSSSKLMVIS